MAQPSAMTDVTAMHLDRQSMARLLSRDMETVAYFRAHLAQGCPTCEEYLAGPDRALEWLDAEMDRLLFTHATPSAEADASGYRAVRRRLRRRRILRALGANAGLVVALSLAAVMTLVLLVAEDRPLEGGVKGAPGAPALELTAVAVDLDGTVTPLSPGGAVSTSASVQLRYRTTKRLRGVNAFLVLERENAGRMSALGEFSLVRGTADLGDGERSVAVSMFGQSGRVALWLVRGADGPKDAEALVAAQLAGQALRPGVGLISFPVNVVP